MLEKCTCASSFRLSPPSGRWGYNSNTHRLLAVNTLPRCVDGYYWVRLAGFRSVVRACLLQQQPTTHTSRECQPSPYTVFECDHLFVVVLLWFWHSRQVLVWWRWRWWRWWWWWRCGGIMAVKKKKSCWSVHLYAILAILWKYIYIYICLYICRREMNFDCLSWFSMISSKRNSRGPFVSLSPLPLVVSRHNTGGRRIYVRMIAPIYIYTCQHFFFSFFFFWCL